MYSLNRAEILGNMTRDPELRQTPAGKPVMTICLATNESYMDAQGQRQERSEYHNIVLWGRLAEIAAQYCEEMPEFSLRLQAKAGLTGYAQVYGKYNTTPYDKLTMDMMYIAHPSIVEDLKIMFATVKILFMPESTEGVSEGQTTAMSGENY